MGYRSNVALKTTTEGWILMKKLNDKIEKDEDKPLYAMTAQKTTDGYYKISNEEIKWYDTYSNVQNFDLALEEMVKQDIPYVFIRIGEDIDDIEVRNNWTDDMPDRLETFEPVTNIYDEDYTYETIMEKGKDVKYKDLFTPPEDEDEDDHELDTSSVDLTHIKAVMFDLFEDDDLEEYDDIKDALCSLNSEGEVSDEEYDFALEHWDEWLEEWEVGDDER